MNSPSRSHTFTLIGAAVLSFVGHATGQDEAATRRVTRPGAQVQINQIETSQFPKAGVDTLLF